MGRPVEQKVNLFSSSLPRYASLLLVALLVSCLMLAPGVESWLAKVPFCEESTGIVGKTFSSVSSSLGVNAPAVKVT